MNHLLKCSIINYRNIIWFIITCSLLICLIIYIDDELSNKYPLINIQESRYNSIIELIWEIVVTISTLSVAFITIFAHKLSDTYYGLKIKELLKIRTGWFLEINFYEYIILSIGCNILMLPPIICGSLIAAIAVSILICYFVSYIIITSLEITSDETHLYQISRTYAENVLSDTLNNLSNGNLDVGRLLNTIHKIRTDMVDKIKNNRFTQLNLEYEVAYIFKLITLDKLNDKIRSEILITNQDFIKTSAEAANYNVLMALFEILMNHPANEATYNIIETIADLDFEGNLSLDNSRTVYKLFGEKLQNFDNLNDIETKINDVKILLHYILTCSIRKGRIDYFRKMYSLLKINDTNEYRIIIHEYILAYIYYLILYKNELAIKLHMFINYPKNVPLEWCNSYEQNFNFDHFDSYTDKMAIARIEKSRARLKLINQINNYINIEKLIIRAETENLNHVIQLYLEFCIIETIRDEIALDLFVHNEIDYKTLFNIYNTVIKIQNKDEKIMSYYNCYCNLMGIISNKHYSIVINFITNLIYNKYIKFATNDKQSLTQNSKDILHIYENIINSHLFSENEYNSSKSEFREFSIAYSIFNLYNYLYYYDAIVHSLIDEYDTSTLTDAHLYKRLGLFDDEIIQIVRNFSIDNNVNILSVKVSCDEIISLDEATKLYNKSKTSQNEYIIKYTTYDDSCDYIPIIVNKEKAINYIKLTHFYIKYKIEIKKSD